MRSWLSAQEAADVVVVAPGDVVRVVHGAFGGSYIPCFKVVYGSDDNAKRDPYGRQVDRLSSLQHCSQGPDGMPTPGRFWINA